MKCHDLLLEYGIEEIPHQNLETFYEEMKKIALNELKEKGFSYKKISFFATPRRLSFLILDIAEKAEDKTIEKKGPKVDIAFKNDKASKALEGFLNANKVDIKDIEKKDGYIFISIVKKGLSLEKFIPLLATNVLNQLPNTPSMRWAKFDASFIRPIRFLNCVLDDKIFDLTLYSHQSKFLISKEILDEEKILTSSNLLYGNKNKKEKVLLHAKDYEKEMFSLDVILDIKERKEIIKKEIFDIEKENKLKAIYTKKELSNLAGITEYPKGILASFNEKFLSLPKEVLTSEMIDQQMYIPLMTEGEKMSHHFIVIVNGFPTPEMKTGNEKVIAARLEDGAFFYRDDQKKDLYDYRELLKNVAFVKGGKSLYDKTLRIEKLTTLLSPVFRDKNPEDTLKVAKLCKADLVTNLVKEFPDLQGTIGYYYAKNIVSENIALGIKEHYYPRFREDSLPTKTQGSIVSVADRLDNLLLLYSLGMFVNGSKDPYALRRDVVGIFRILLNKRIHISLNEFITSQLESLYKNFLKKDTKEVKDILMKFITSRANTVLEDLGFSLLDINSVLDNKNVDDIYDTYLRLIGLEILRKKETLDFYIDISKRLRNICKDKLEIKEVREELFIEEIEKELFTFYEKMHIDIIKEKEDKNYMNLLNLLLEYQNILPKFFDRVIVNDDNKDIKNNRLALLLLIEKDINIIINFNKL